MILNFYLQSLTKDAFINSHIIIIHIIVPPMSDCVYTLHKEVEPGIKQMWDGLQLDKLNTRLQPGYIF